MSKQSEYRTRITRLNVLLPGVQVINEKGWSIEIENQNGEFVAVSDTHNGGMIEIDPEEWPALRDAIDRMIGECVEIAHADLFRREDRS